MLVRHHRPIVLLACGLLLAGVLSSSPAAAQMIQSQFAQPAPPTAILNQVGIDQKLGEQVPLDLVFRDESGTAVPLRQYFGQRPVVLALVYYQCPMLCTMTLNGMVKAFRTLNFDVGNQFEVVTISFDPRETAQLAAAKKQQYIKHYGRANSAAGWHFLTGDEDAIRQLTASVGFRYTWDAASQQYAHATGLILLTPQGQVSRYLYGLEYSPRDLRLGLIEASQNRIGTLTDQVLLLCYHYDPMTGRYGFAITAALRVGAVLTMTALGGFVLLMLRRERRARKRSVAIGP